MKRTAFGLITPEGLEPALSASTALPPWMRAKASAIWLRLEFSTQTNSTRFIGTSAATGADADGDRLLFGRHGAGRGAAACRFAFGLGRRAADRAIHCLTVGR